MQCNFMNEGCNGGWPLLNGYFGESFSVPLESCAPYQASTAGDSCSNYSKCPKAVRVQKSYYIGGSYGSSSEAAMMKEIRANGPIVADIDVPLGFSYYKSGIFSEDHQSGEGLSETRINDMTLKDYHIMWEYINHSIIIVGWGKDDSGVKFWICRNSYGTRFGEDGGHFRVRRGQNDLGIES